MSFTPHQCNELQQLWSVRGFPALSVYLPLDTPQAGKATLQELAHRVADRSDAPAAAARAAVREAQAALDQAVAQVDGGTLVFLAGREIRIRLLLPVRLAPMATLDARVHLRPLLCAAESLRTQTVISLSPAALRIYQGQPNRLRMVHSASPVPTARSSARRLSMARLDGELRRMQAAEGPIVLCATPDRARLFERHSAFGASLNLSLAALRGVPPQVVQRELRGPLHGVVLARRKHRLASFPRLLRAGLLRLRMREILAAARAGMVETLLLTRHTDPDRAPDEHQDRLNLAAIQTLAGRGSVLCVDEGAAPVAAGAAAFVRFGWA